MTSGSRSRAIWRAPPTWPTSTALGGESALLLVARPEDQTHGRAVQLELFPQLIRQITAIREMDSFGIIHRENEGRRLHLRLGRVIELDRLSVKQRRRKLGDDALEPAVERAGRRALGERRICGLH